MGCHRGYRGRKSKQSITISDDPFILVEPLNDLISKDSMNRSFDPNKRAKNKKGKENVHYERNPFMEGVCMGQVWGFFQPNLTSSD